MENLSSAKVAGIYFLLVAVVLTATFGGLIF